MLALLDVARPDAPGLSATPDSAGSGPATTAVSGSAAFALTLGLAASGAAGGAGVSGTAAFALTMGLSAAGAAGGAGVSGSAAFALTMGLAAAGASGASPVSGSASFALSLGLGAAGSVGAVAVNGSAAFALVLGLGATGVTTSSTFTLVQAMVTVGGARELFVRVGDVPPSTPLTVQQIRTGLPVDLTTANGVTGVTAALYRADVSPAALMSGWPRACHDLTSAGQAVVDWASGDFSVAGDYLLDLAIDFGAANVDTTIVPLYVRVEALP